MTLTKFSAGSAGPVPAVDCLLVSRQGSHLRYPGVKKKCISKQTRVMTAAMKRKRRIGCSEKQVAMLVLMAAVSPISQGCRLSKHKRHDM